VLASVVVWPALLGGGCAPGASSAAGGAGSPAAAEALAERLPAAAAGFRRGATRPAVPGEGREIGYSTEAGRSTAVATVELLAEATPAAALDAAVAETSRGGPAREMREAGRLALGDGAASPLFCAETVGRYGRERVAGLVCAGRFGGALLRIRVTMPAGREPAPADPRAFAAAILARLRGA
jgi:hypothetical protein